MPADHCFATEMLHFLHFLYISSGTLDGADDWPREVSLRGFFQPVADAGFRDDDAWVEGVVTQFLAQVLHVDA